MKVNLEDLGDYPLPRHIITVVKQVLHKGYKVAANDPIQSLSLNVAFVSIDEITKLNNAYRKKDSPTDVLSFPREGNMVCSLGDIVICSSVAARQAKEYGHSLEREIAFLALHGLLHLLGYSHDESGLGKETKAGDEMVKLQNEILASLGMDR